MNNISRRLKLGGSLLALAAIASFVSQAAMAQSTGGADSALESVVVTGTSIRGINVIGSNIITVDPATIATQAPATLEQLFNAIPALSNSGAPPQGPNGTSYFSANIHGLGASASNATLEVIDGRRIVGGGTAHSQIDPGIVPVIALQRVDVLADGASSIYGSDAVAGVVNLITRDRYQGVEVTSQGGIANNYSTYNAGLLMGQDWGKGWVELAGGLTYQSSLDKAARPFTATANYTSFGGLNGGSANCAQATIQPAGSKTAYYTPVTSTSPYTLTASNAPCDYSGQGNELPQEKRYNGMIKGQETFGNVVLSGTFIYSVRRDNTKISPTASTISATAFQTGAQANPFYVNPPSVSTTTQTVDFNAEGIIPLGTTETGSSTLNSTVRADWNVDDNWLLSLTDTFGADNSYSYTIGGFCSSCALLALNGTTNTSGSTTASSVPAVNTIALNSLPLTTATALDVWSPPATNQTSAAVRQTLVAGNSYTTNLNNQNQATLSINGDLFRLPAGMVKLAAGVEHYNAGLQAIVTTPNNTGPDTRSPVIKGTQTGQYTFERVVDSEYLELAIPVISPSMDIPFVQRLDVDISGRHDFYSDVGGTSNPKYSGTWLVMDGFKLTSSYSTSFVAPALDLIGDKNQGYVTSSSSATPYSTTFNVNTALFPGVAGALPGCAAGATTCQIATATTPGIVITKGAGQSLKPATGNSWSIGTDIAPDILPGFEAVVTFFNNSLKGGDASPTEQLAGSVASLASTLTICPTSCTVAQENAAIGQIPLTKGALPAPAYFIFNGTNANILYLHVGGFDYNLQYQFDTDYGHFKVGDAATIFVKVKEANAAGIPYYNIINTNGLNSSFPSVQDKQRFNFGWSQGPYAIDLFVNYTGGYRDWGSGTITPVGRDALGLPTGGGDVVKSWTTLDVHAAYNIPTGFAAGDQIYIDGKNIFDTDPPFIQGSLAFGNGYDRVIASPIGRIVSVGLNMKF